MTKKTKTFDVKITASTESWGYFDPDVLHCNPMTMDEINAYIDEMRHHHKIPSDSCLYRIDLNFQDIFQKKYFITSEPPHFDSHSAVGYERSEGRFDICVKLRNGCKCAPEDCFKNIKNGKCTDKFIRAIICEKLFKDKYIKQQEER